MRRGEIPHLKRKELKICSFSDLEGAITVAPTVAPTADPTIVPIIDPTVNPNAVPTAGVPAADRTVTTTAIADNKN